MESKFFQQVNDLNISGDLNITIKSGSEGIMIVSILLNNTSCGDNAKKHIPPLILKGTAQELDNGFIDAVKVPVESTSGILVNMEAYLKQQEIAKQHSAMEKAKTEQEKKQKEVKDKKYKEGMEQADQLEKEGKFKEAWMKVPDLKDYPEYADELRKRKSELSAQFAPDLFNVTADQAS